ncbi:phosphotriesterase family protein [Orbus sturtevantii]|uniref:phosphotriesterase family protein n=1 Tax=Orbus sturtevantii TaxID=3074109 RepID=UPI00370DB4C6
MLNDGITYMHEHTTIDLSSVKNSEDTNLNCFWQTVNEYKILYEKGVRNIVDVTNAGMRRNPIYVKQIADLTNINIIQSTGFYTEKFISGFIANQSIKQIANFMINEIEVGIESTDIKAHIIGEIGSSKNGWTLNEKKIFAAAVLAHKATNKPITTHTTLGTFAIEQVHFFKKNSVDLSKVVIGHLDLNPDIDQILNVLEQGVYIEFDTVGKQNYLPDLTRINMLKEIEKRGYVDQVFLSMDVTRRSSLTHFGGIGYAYLLDVFVPMMLEHGISDSFINKMLAINPQKFMNRN